MGKNRRSVRADHTREELGAIVSRAAIGDKLLSAKVAVALSSRRKSVPARTVGLLMRERGDVRKITDGMWEKI